jgi:hypothetical protein
MLSLRAHNRSIALLELKTTLSYTYTHYFSTQEGGDATPQPEGDAPPSPPSADAPLPPLSSTDQPAISPRIRRLSDPDVILGKKFPPRLARWELGSYADPAVREQIRQEEEILPRVSDQDGPLYDMQDTFRELFQPQHGMTAKAAMSVAKERPTATAEEIAEVLGFGKASDKLTRSQISNDPSLPQPILTWQERLVMVVGMDKQHPSNNKMKMWVHIRDLQRETRLSDDAMRRIAEICDKKYDPATGVLTLSSDKYPHRDENKHRIEGMLADLIAEGQRWDEERGIMRWKEEIKGGGEEKKKKKKVATSAAVKPKKGKDN